MGIFTALSRMWLTRSVKPFRFTGDYDHKLPYEDCEGLGLYIHIPFCQTLCTFCPYCKVPYNRELCDRYLDALLREIHQVGGSSPGKTRVTSLYIGGGTPALAAERLGEGIRAGDAVDLPAMSAALAQVPFQTVSMDFIFALPGQRLEDLVADLSAAFASGANHAAIYPFIDFTFTDSPLRPMPKGEKRRLLDGITRWCLDQGCTRTSLWTFAREAGAEYSSMTRDNFLGFGCSAATLLREQFKLNTFSVEEYCRRVNQGLLPTALTLRFTLRQRMVYYLFWTAYSTQVDPAGFQRFFGVPLERMYGLELTLARLKEAGLVSAVLSGGTGSIP